MQFRIHVDGRGERWVVTRCGRCREIHKYAPPTPASAPILCKSCHAILELGPLPEPRGLDGAAPA